MLSGRGSRGAESLIGHSRPSEGMGSTNVECPGNTPSFRKVGGLVDATGGGAGRSGVPIPASWVSFPRRDVENPRIGLGHVESFEVRRPDQGVALNSNAPMAQLPFARAGRPNPR